MKRLIMLALTVGLIAGIAMIAVSGDNETGTQAEKAAMTDQQTTDYRSIPFNTITGDETKLADYEGKVLLLVNTASKCGYTPQYEGLEELYRKYNDSGLVVIGFPANNFGGQEPGTNEEIQKFCTSKFDVTFPMMAKVSVKGDDKHPLFAYLTEESNITGEIKWNFSKFLIDRDGNLVARYESKVEPMSKELVSDIEKQL